MSATTFLLILAGVILVFVGFMIKSWSELSNVTRRHDHPKKQDEDQNHDESP